MHLLIAFGIFIGYVGFMAYVLYASSQGKEWANKLIDSFGQYPEYGL